VEAAKRDPLTNRAIASIREVVPSLHTPGELLLITVDGELAFVREEEGVRFVELPRGSGEAVDVVFIQQFADALLVGTDRGALFSNDSGQTWTALDLPVTTTSTHRNAVVRVSPTNPSRLLIAIDSVVYRSEDGGETFNTLSLGLPNHVITDISINPANASRVLLGTVPVSS
jgi:hypothetical protein